MNIQKTKMVDGYAMTFNVKGKTIVVGAYQAVTLSELKAINKQVEELEWND